MGVTNDSRCNEALDLLETKRMNNGAWTSNAKYYTTTSMKKLNGDYVDWGPVSTKNYNEWVTTDALFVLKEMGSKNIINIKVG